MCGARTDAAERTETCDRIVEPASGVERERARGDRAGDAADRFRGEADRPEVRVDECLGRREEVREAAVAAVDPSPEEIVAQIAVDYTGQKGVITEMTLIPYVNQAAYPT